MLKFWKKFISLNIEASAFGLFLLFIIIISKKININFITPYDFIFISAVLFQIFFLITKRENKKEFLVIIIFHILATIMELFKTSGVIGSWNYPDIKNSYFVILTVPLFAGFFYSAVGSYLSRLFKLLNLIFYNFPKYFHLLILSTIIYINFFSHHYFYDLRYILFIYIFVIFWKTKIEYYVNDKKYKISFLYSLLFISILVWIAENISTFNKIWLYPNQTKEWVIVSPTKIGSWFLLLILSFSLVSLIYKDRLKNKKK